MMERTKCEVYSRVQGYYRPVAKYNIGKKGEFNQRVFFTNEKAQSCSCSSELIQKVA
jgi:ribonucleoside-triphosphate reductase